MFRGRCRPKCPCCKGAHGGVGFVLDQFCIGAEFAKRTLAPALDGAVNKSFLSTGETGELAGENLGFGVQPWG